MSAYRFLHYFQMQQLMYFRTSEGIGNVSSELQKGETDTKANGTK